ncbi:hypothetical protein SPRG_11735 [Saprolegnia parasitica CBS 223.65]|uniref:Uncharacterized protein n=1 Tax=Saprolegnia parasitica (strain CBS 223.65) TaxID=695850 RepID=A0A067BW96_SAPPC|nr:hypothetical protein SPRG_11735 [Saprolegnia parasitica CBS 223.65]KDO22553.1 hypothetical protein SPRG_11735 [Saprolegnia parasitica CBS 223.65]|eukprot:XP_012206799.1 hypothetical protein SPRG_11735 [Saprolegnia parasitica CBS 223.65]
MGPSYSVSVHAWVFPTRLDAIEAMATMLAAEANDVMLLETLSIEVRGTSMTAHLRFNRETITCSIGSGSLLEYVGAVPLQLDTAESCAMRGFGLVAKAVEVGLYRSVVRERSYDAAVMLPITSTPCEGPTQARLLRHNPFGIQVSWVSPVQTSSSLPGTVLVELAPFSKTFWDRYKDMWWFERGHLSIVQRLYRVVHRGTLSEEPSTIVLTDVHAAALRVTIFNHDHVGTYCPPYYTTVYQGATIL